MLVALAGDKRASSTGVQVSKPVWSKTVDTIWDSFKSFSVVSLWCTWLPQGFLFCFFFLALIGSSSVRSSGSKFVTLALSHVQEKAATFPEVIARFAVVGSNYSRVNKFVRQDSLFCPLFGTILSCALCVTLEKSLWCREPMCFS